MHIIRPPEYLVMPWKNGGGTTTELCACPRGAAAFDWRASIAVVNQNGPFSAFGGYERHIMVLSGNGMRLEIAGRGTFELQPFEPVSFSGEVQVVGVLSEGGVQDFNLIVRRTFGCGLLRVMDFEPGEEIGSEDGLRFFYLLEGGCHFGDDIILYPNDSFWLDRGEHIRLTAFMKAVVCAITPR